MTIANQEQNNLQQAASPDASASEPAKEAYLEQALWSRLTEAPSAEAFAAAWLEIQCKMTGDVSCGVVVLGPPDKGPFLPVAYWPEESDVSLKLSNLAELVMAERQGAVRKGDTPDSGQNKAHDTVAYPLLVDAQMCGVVAIEIEHRSEEQLRSVMRHLQWGCAWLEVLIRRKTFTAKDRLVTVLELLAICLEHEHYQAAATAFVTELATILSCERVSIGRSSGSHIRVQAFSHSAEFGKKTNLIQVIGAAMDEAVDQQDALVFPSLPGSQPRATHAHTELAHKYGAGGICTVPLSENGKMTGALTLERPRGQSFDARDLELCRHIGALAGPVLESKYKDDRWLIVKIWDAAHDLLSKLIGRRHIGFKLASLAIIGLGLFLVLATGTYRVTAEALLEGTIQRVVSAPIAGYIAQANARAGDIVQQGDVLCTLDDRDLLLEHSKWLGQKEERLREYSKSLAEGDRAQVRILGAQIQQAETQIQLLDEQLARTRILAPFDGMIVTGDLSQSLSAPVERGQVLFEVAPLDSYRVILKVDEREISQIDIGMQGQLALAGLPGEKLPMTVEKITPVSVAEDGRNYFRVEAALQETTEPLRPGMEGIGKITIEQRSQAWIWTHKTGHWFRLWLWSWWP
jgi:RND family efflux transporter MFP subunit